MRITQLWLFATLCLFAAFEGTAQAQTIKPLEIETDENGVDLLSGQIKTREPVLSLPGAGNLRFTRINEILPIMIGQLPPGIESFYQINNGGSTSESIECLDTDCQSNKYNGSTLQPSIGSRTFDYSQGGSGKRIFFDKEHSWTFSTNNNTWRFLFYPSWIEWADGERHTYTYDTDSNGTATHHRPTKITSNLGYEMRLTYQSNVGETGGWQTVSTVALYKSSAPNIPLARLTYSGSNVTDLAGRTWVCGGCNFLMSAKPLVNATSLKLPGQTATTYTATAYSSSGSFAKPVGQIVRDGTSWNYSYQNLTHVYQDTTTPKFSKITVTGPSGFTRSADIWHPTPGSPASPHVTRITNGLNQQTNYVYDFWGRLTKITQPEGNSVSVTYDYLGNITEKRIKNKSGGGDLVETAYYSSSAGSTPCIGATCFRPDWTRDAAGKQTDYTWHSSGALLTRTEPTDYYGKRRRTIYEYYPGLARIHKERVCSITSGGANDTCGTVSEQVTEYTYWGNTFLPATVKRTNGTGSLSAVTTNTYDAAGRLLSSDGPLPGNGDATYRRYDTAGRKTWEIGPQGALGSTRPATRMTYRDADDQPTMIETGTVPSHTSTALTVFQTVAHSYNTKRLRTKTEVRNGSGSIKFGVTQFSYNARNQLECSAVRMNPALFSAPPSNACALGTEGPNGPDRITRVAYDVLGRPSKTVGGYGVMNGGAGNVESELGYTANGQIQWRKDGNGNRTQYVYDSHDRNSHIYYPHKTSVGAYNTGDRDYFTYDTRGNVLWHYRRDNRRVYHDYDSAGRLWRKRYWTPSQGWLSSEYILYGYDGLGRPTYERRASGSGQGLTHTYDALGRLASTTDNMHGGSRTLSYLYDIAGRRTRLTHPDGVFFTYDYYPSGQVKEVKQSSSTNLVTYGYDGLGRMTTISRANGRNTTVGYDPISRPSSYNHNGLVNTSFSYNAANQIISRTISNNAYAWGDDVNINHNYATNGLNQYTTAGSESYSYDGSGNLTGDGTFGYSYDIENRLTTKSGGASANLSYDPKGRLSRISGSAGTTRFLYDGDELVAEMNSAGTITRRYVHGAGVDDPLVWYEGSGLTDRRHLIADERGSIINISNTSGSTIRNNTYDDWGTPATTNLGRFQYTGQIYMPELGAYYYKARMYSPKMGRFFQTDPIGYEDGMNMYAYVGNDPVNAIDPTGLQSMMLPREGSIYHHIADNLGNPDSVQSKVIAELPGIGDAATAVEAVTDPTPLKILAAIVAVVPVVGNRLADALGGVPNGLPDAALVVRGGADITPESIVRGTGRHPSGVEGFSVESKAGACLADLCKNVSHNQVGVTTAGDVRARGGDVIPTSGRSPNHATVTGLDPGDASDLLSPSIPNPVPKPDRNF